MSPSLITYLNAYHAFNNKTFKSLFCLFIGVFIFSTIDPHSWAVWVAEIIPVLIGILCIILISRHFSFSRTAYALMFVWLLMHTIGAKYTFAEVPFDWFNHLIGSERNQYDRVAHYSIGFYAYPIAEFLFRKCDSGKTIATLFGLFAIMSLAAGYEIIEWWYAELAGGEEGIAFLGSQGDIWDAQKDMLCDTLGAITSLLLFHYQNRRP
ncbi:DUF2238 domain-containing protein [Vibrio albus]|uniref:DUF2238 domain-containing protein n=1 Tax=Vibrio albus TaxID=2200953 RepID=A0A2U3B5Y8_9VIBR|nr:DUF2238 domain-containing protein [Vibrio albus]PWI32216.1 DUF2238 domain-containing protein [Vibrio albus]